MQFASVGCVRVVFTCSWWFWLVILVFPGYCGLVGVGII